MRSTSRIVLKITLIAIVLATAVVVLFLPRTEFFKGALIPAGIPQETVDLDTVAELLEPASIVIHYTSNEDDIEVEIEDAGVLLFSAEIVVENEPVQVTGVRFELEGDASINNFEFRIDGESVSDVNFMFLDSGALLADLSSNPQTIDNLATMELFGDIVDAEAESVLRIHVTNVVARGAVTGSGITNVGINSEIYPYPLTLRFGAI